MNPESHFHTLFKRLYRLCLAPIIDTVYPPLCVLCNSLLPPGRMVVCHMCMESLTPAPPDTLLTIEKQSFNQVYILFQYDDRIRQLIHHLKYKRVLALSTYFAERANQQFAFTDRYSVIIPVPLHTAKYRERGYNQSAVIASEIGRICHTPIDETLLVRKRFTASQTHFTREQRVNNLKNAFSCSRNLSGARILLVDDVITTGSTVEACAVSILNANAKYIDVFALANPTLMQSKTEL